MPKKHLYLPKIVPGANLDEPVSNALWEDKQKKVILAISDGIEIDETAQTRGVSSIPDIYARPLSFLGALRSQNHPLRRRVLQEWKGLLSLLALHKVMPDLDGLTITPVLLGDEKLSTALKNLAPAPVRLQQNGTEYLWTDILLIRFGEIALGAFSPVTLVYTSADYNTQLAHKFFALKDEKGYLKPPGKDEGLHYVGEWLENFIRRFNQFALNKEESGSNVHQYAGDINKWLDAWLSEIRKELGYEPGSRIEVPGVKPAEEFTPLSSPASFISKYNIYKALLTPLVKDESAAHGGNKSEYALTMARNRSPYKEVVVIHQQQLVENKILWDTQRPSGLGDPSKLIETFFKQPSGTVINRISLEADKAVWIRPELYFLSNTLLKAKDGDILNESERFLNAGNTSFLLPFKKEILQFFSPVQIQEIIKPKFKKSGENGIEFSFYLPLAMNQQIEVKKMYLSKGADASLGQGVIKETEAPVLEIFPNYLGDFWCQYFMLCSDTDKFTITPYNYDHNISLTRREQKHESNDSSGIRAELVRIAGENAFPEGVEIKPANAFEEPFGIILINKNKDVEGKPFNGEALIGIDFGTSNTNIFKRSNDNADRWKFSFSKYVRSLLNTGGNSSNTNSKRNRLTRMFFVPAEDQQLPIPTALRIFKAGITTNMLLDYFIFFPDASRYPDNVYTDIKWDDDNAKLNSFLKSLIFLLIVDLVGERVGKISFRCSYPKSFTNDRIADYKRYWTEILSNFFGVQKGSETVSISSDQFIFIPEKRFEHYGDEYIISTNNNGKLNINIIPEFATEGIAAGEYFSSEYIIKDGISYANKADGSVCIDVGGGTSDYSIWFDSKIRIDASVLLAGKQISRLLKNNSRVRDILLSEDSAASLNEVKNDDTLFFSRLNYVLRKEEKFIASKLSNNANNKDIAWLRRILAIEFGALSFYAAHLCLALDDFVQGDLAERIKVNGIKLHWGGNAAKFINWIDYGRYEKDGIASKLLNGMFINTILDKTLAAKAFKPAMLAQVQSPGHKDEASGGIVVMNIDGYQPEASVSAVDEMIIEDEPSSDMLNGLVIGEKILINNKLFEHYQTISKDMLFNNNTSLFGGTELTQLERFLHLINQVGKITGLFPEGSQIVLSLEEKLAIKQRAKNDIAALARLKPGARVIEPVFIMEVKYLLDILSNKMR